MCSPALVPYFFFFFHCWQVYFAYSSITFTFLPYTIYCIVLFYGAQAPPQQQAAAATTRRPTHPIVAQLTRRPEGCGEGDHSTPCQLDGSGLVSFAFYLQSLSGYFGALASVFTAVAQVKQRQPR